MIDLAIAQQIRCHSRPTRPTGAKLALKPVHAWGIRIRQTGNGIPSFRAHGFYPLADWLGPPLNWLSSGKWRLIISFRACGKTGWMM